MITVTPPAAAQILQSAGGAGLRLAARLDDKGVIEYGMGFDEQAEGDEKVVSNGVTILVSPGSVELLSADHTDPPAATTLTALYCDAPVNTSSDITQAWSTEPPAATAVTPNTAPKAPITTPTAALAVTTGFRSGSSRSSIMQ